MNNPEKLTTLGTQDKNIKKKQKKHNTKCAGHNHTQETRRIQTLHLNIYCIIL
jgi:hypothetical protein